jgi:hypothetical protein
MLTPPSQSKGKGTYFTSPVAGVATKGLQRQKERHHRRTIQSNEGVDGLKKSGIIGGSQRRNAFGPDVEAAESTTLRYGETALKKGVDEAEKPAIMGGSQRRKRRGTRERR